MLDRWMGAGQIATPSPQDAWEQDRDLYGKLDSISGLHGKIPDFTVTAAPELSQEMGTRLGGNPVRSGQ